MVEDFEEHKSIIIREKVNIDVELNELEEKLEELVQKLRCEKERKKELEINVNGMKEECKMTNVKCDKMMLEKDLFRCLNHVTSAEQRYKGGENE